MNSQQRDGYTSYLLRLWRAREGEQLVWRASLDDPLTGERIGFIELEAMFNYLRQKTELVVSLCEGKTDALEGSQD
jgi:hypothetical protein